MTTNALQDFHTCISVPLINKTLTVSSAKIVNGLNSPNRFTAMVFLSFIQLFSQVGGQYPTTKKNNTPTQLFFSFLMISIISPELKHRFKVL